jgi:SAM-dependent methyltransferase
MVGTIARYTHGHHDSVLRSHRWRTVENSAAYLSPRIVPGMSLLDVGCGPGTLTVDLARLTDPGRVVGVDVAESIVDQARRDAATNHPNVEFQTADVYELGFESDTFDIVHAHQVLQHLDDPVAALREMRRVCRPGGVVAVRDADYAAMAWAPEDARLDRWMGVYRSVAVANGGQPDAGRHLLGWAMQAGLTNIDSTASVWCFATPAERAWWGGLWADRIRMSTFADHAIGHAIASAAELDELAAGWLDWARRDDGWFAVLHGEVIGTAD